MTSRMLESTEEKINSIISNRDIFGIIMNKKREFSEMKKSSIDKKFSELIFCTLTANTSAEMGLRCQKYIENIQLYDRTNLKNALVACHYRFPNTRSRFISQNYENRSLLEDILRSPERRELLTDTYLGIGMKEASHFLRNVGFFEYSILDKHIRRFLSDYYGREIRIKNGKDYEREEKHFIEISSKYGLEPGIMDLVIWYLMTGKILK
jgi:N-glycosylase/DNA lyase